MTPGQYDIALVRGSYAELLRLGTGPTGTTAAGILPGGVAIDWTGCTAQLEIRKGDETQTLIAEATTANGRITLSSNGRLLAVLPASVTANIAVGEYRYDLRIVDAAGLPQYYLAGAVRVLKRTTKGGGP